MRGVPEREVIVGDGLAWLRDAELTPRHAIVTSLPDVSEFPGMSVADWSGWFIDTVARCCEAAHPEGLVAFYQTDIKRDGRWVDKGYLVHRGAEQAGSACLWHKIICRVSPGFKTFGRPAYGHLQAFSAALRLSIADSTPDVVDGLGVMTWSRAMPTTAAEAMCTVLDTVEREWIVVDPFCGRGTILAMANAHGYDAVGVDISKKRVRKARALAIDDLREGVG